MTREHFLMIPVFIVEKFPLYVVIFRFLQIGASPQ